jgi:ribosomal protein L40E
VPGATAESAVGGTLILLTALLMISYPCYRVISLVLDKAIDTVEGTVYLVVLLGFVGGIVSSWGTPLGLLLLVLLAALCVGVQLVQRVANQRALDAMDAEDLAECDAIIARQPTLSSSYKRAVDICRRRGEYDRAASYVEQYLERAGEDEEMEKLLERLKRLLRQQRLGVKICPECAAENPPGSHRCGQCNRLLALPTDLLAGCATEAGLRALSASSVTLLVVGILLAASRAESVVTGAVFVSAFSTFVVYLYLRA